MGKIIIYGLEMNPPVRSVLLTMKALGLEHELRKVSIVTRDQLKEEYMKMNPEHTVPTVDDNGKIMWDSHAITAYLVRKYAKSDTLYPNEPHQRAIVDQRLHFDSGILFRPLRQLTFNMLYTNNKVITPDLVEKIETGYDFLETFLQHDYVAGHNMTIADFCIFTTVTGLMMFVPFDAAKKPRITAWIKRMQTLPYHDSVNSKGSSEYAELIRTNIR